MVLKRVAASAGFMLGVLLAAAGQQSAPPLPADHLAAERLTGKSQLGLPETIPGIDNSPAAVARLRLGRKLFFDPILSLDRSVSCASCHEPEKAFAGNEAKPLGVLGRRCARNAPTIFNRALGSVHMWDGRAPTLEAQALLPIENENEMALPLDQALQRLADDVRYRELFAAAGAPAPTREVLGASIAEFVRRLVLGDSPIDRFRAAKGEVTPLEKRGLWVFESKGRCWRCHAGPNFSDESFHNTGVGVVKGEPEPGRAAITGDAADTGKFRTPTLRSVALTAPYMHDGSQATLEDVVRFYQRNGTANPSLDPILAEIEINDEDVAALVALLQALSRSASGDAPGAPVAAPKKAVY